MSASEKLRELEQAMIDASLNARSEDHVEATLTLNRALPQIVALVERVEREHDRPHMVPLDMVGCRLCYALTALDEALS